MAVDHPGSELELEGTAQINLICYVLHAVCLGKIWTSNKLLLPQCILANFMQ